MTRIQRYVLVCNGDSCWIPHRFWEWKIMDKDDLDRSNGRTWHQYQGSWSSVPTEVQQEVERFEKRLGHAIIRPSAIGDKQVMIGG